MYWLIPTLIACAGIFSDDLKSRSVHLYWFIILLIGLLGMSLTTNLWIEVAINLGVNLLFLFLLFALLSLYFSIRQKRIVNLFETHIGLGDILFFLVICFYFPFVNYIVFFTVSLIFSLLVSPIIFYFQGRRRHIPLAGLQALFLAGYLILETIDVISFTNFTLLDFNK